MKTGLLIKISYKGKYFDSFDELKGKKSVKKTLKDYLISKNIKIYKGLQQAARTDAKVDAKENYIYIITEKFNIDILEFNINIEGLKILEAKFVKKDLILPDLVKRRKYIYFYPKKYKKNDIENIIKACEKLSGIKDFRDFTNHKGKKLKNLVREVYISYIDDKIYFDGVSFLPHQVRLMSGYILKGKIELMPAKYLILNEVVLEEKIFEK